MGIDIVQRFADLRVLVIGDVMLDSYLEGTADRLCSEGPVPVVRKTAEERVAGGAANTAANLQALGAQVALLGVVGPDQPGKTLRTALRAQGIDDRWLVEDDAGWTLHKLRVLAGGQYVVRFDEGETCAAHRSAQQQLLRNLDLAFWSCDLVVVSDYAYGVVSEALIERLRMLRAERPCVLVIDSKDLKRVQRAQATVVTPNHREAWQTVAPSTRPHAVNLEEMEQVGTQLLTLIDAEWAAITLGAHGVLLVDRNDFYLHIPARPVTHPNDVGAGDSFTAALALALGAGADREHAARIAIEAAAIAVTKERTAIVTQQELLQRVSLGHYEVASRARAPFAHVCAQVQAARYGTDGSPRTVVFTNGVFDLLHAGHIHFLRAAKMLGDVLVVGINSDRSARRLKGKHRPINTEQDRMALVAALEPVDYVVLFDEDTPVEVIRALRPDVHVKGGDYAGQELPEAAAVRECGGRVEIVPLIGRQSTSDVIDRILHLAALPQRNEFADVPTAMGTER